MPTYKLKLENFVQRAGLLFEKEVIYPGRYRTEETEFQIDIKDLEHWVQIFKEFKEKGVSVPLVAGHSMDPRDRLGTVEDLFIKDNSRGVPALFALVRFRDEEAAKTAELSDVSLYAPKRAIIAGKEYNFPILHIGVTDYPVIHGMDSFDLVASFIGEEKEMKLSKELEERLQKLELSVKSEEDLVKALEEQRSLICSLQDEIKGLKEGASGGSAPEPKETVDPIQLNLLRDNRQLKLERLLESGKITPAMKKAIEERYSSEAGLSLSLTNTEHYKAFDFLLSILEQNTPIQFGEKSGAQSFGLPKNDDGEENLLLKQAEEWAKEFHGN